MPHTLSSKSVLLLIGFAALLIGWLSPTQAATNVTVLWNANPETTVAGYRVYYGTSSGVYSQSLDVGNTTTTRLSSLTAGTTYFFAVTAYDTTGTESLPSTEVSYSVPAASAPPGSISALQILNGGRVQLTMTMGTPVQRGQAADAPPAAPPPAQTVDVQYSNDLSVWSVLETVTYTSGEFYFVDSGAADVSRRFYRLVFH